MIPATFQRRFEISKDLYAMKNLVWRLVVPLTIISFAAFTKWWYALPVDAPDTIFFGFPFPFVCSGWHTSFSLRIFLFEFLIDLLLYFTFWLVLVFCVNRYIMPVKTSHFATILLSTLSTLIFVHTILMASNKDHLFYLKRGFDMEVMETGFKFRWQSQPRPNYYQYHPLHAKEKITNPDFIVSPKHETHSKTKTQLMQPIKAL